MRLEDMWRVHPLMSRDKRCSKCDAVVGIYPSGQKILSERPDVAIVCHRCYEPAPIQVLPADVFKEVEESIPNPEIFGQDPPQ